MKKIALVLSSFFLWGLTSCMEKAEVREKPVTEVTDLKVPADFTWKMSHDVLLTVESPIETVVEVFTSEKCGESDLLATLPAPVQEMTLSVANTVQKLYVRYVKKDGAKAVVTSNAMITRATSDFTVKLPEDTGEYSDVRDGCVLKYPAGGYGTILFEDNWPEKGDYDLNDLVAHYLIQIDYAKTGAREIEAIIVNVKLTALGGSYPYQLCMQAKSLKSNDASVDDYGSYTTGTYEVISTGDEPFTVAFDWRNMKGSNGGSYYNTEDGHLALGSLDDNQVRFVIYLDEIMTTKEFPHDSFDFFIRRTDGKMSEIHLRGYEPTDAFVNGYAAEAGGMGNAYYSSADNFVWGIKVPKNIAHPKERVSILKAYPEFEGWVTSGGTENGEWYEHCEAANCVPLK